MVSSAALAPLIVAALTLAASYYAFSWGLDDLIRSWGAEENGHSYFLPFLALLLALHRLAARVLPPKASWTGVGVAAAGFGLLVAGELSAFRQLAHYGFFFCLVGMALTYLGMRVVWRLLPAWVLLFFAIPLPVQIGNILSLKLKLLSSSLGASFLNLIGISVFQDGNVIDLGSFQLQVVDACSGLNYLFPLMSLGFLIAYLLKSAMWKRALVFVSTIPITIFLNAFRIAVIGVTVSLWGDELAKGLIHEFEGWIVFLLCLLLLWSLVALMLKLSPDDSFDFGFFTLPKGPFLTARPRLSSAAIALLVVSLAGAALVGTGFLKNRPQNAGLTQDLTLFPLSLNGWSGQVESMDPATLRALDLTGYWMANYRAPDSKAGVGLYIAYYAQQKMGSTIHSPATCIPGGGWEIETLDEISLPSQNQTVARMIVRKGLGRQAVYYWFNQGGRYTASRLNVKKQLLLDALFHNRTDGALIRVTTDIMPSETQDAAEQRLQRFVTAADPILRGFLPKENAE